ncbi:MAG: zinc dependent phospholipase C family protein [Lachnospiraceae bacterium]|nr:zinc dependent phospholipase C family protein [Lachnospiraceae bacterium]
MPACYTHKKVGAIVYHLLSGDTRKLVRKHLPFFLIGLHGPDILFFQPAVKKAEAADYGHSLHHEAFSHFYENARNVIRSSEDDRQLVYLYGYLCHLFSDNMIHEVLPELYKEAGVSHGKLEAELDRYLMTEDGYDPISYPVAAHISCTREAATVIAPFYLGVSEEQVLACLFAMKAAFTFSRSSSKVYRKAAGEVMAFAGFGEKIPSMIMTAEASEACFEQMPQLRYLVELSANRSAEAIEGIGKYLFFDEILPDFIALRMDGKTEP